MKFVTILLVVALLAVCSSAVNVHEQTTVHVEKNGEEGADCSLCSYLVGTIENYVEKNLTEAQIILDLQNDCSVLGSLSGDCKALVAAFGPLIINKVIAAQNPITICTDIGLCSNSSAAIVAKEVTPVTGTATCMLCSYLVGKIETYLNLTMNETAIISALENDCNKLGPIAGECSEVVANYGPMIIQELENNASPLDVCTDIGLCTSKQAKKSAKKPVAKKAVKGDAECAICNYLVARVEGYLEGNLTVSEVVAALENDCADLGGLSSECKIAVSLYGTQIVDYLVNKSNPITVCTEIGLCTSASAQKKIAKPVQNEIGCTICNYLVGKVESYLSGDNLNATAIEVALYNDCSDLGPMASICQDIVERYAEEIIEAIVNNENPITVCTEIGLCSSKQVKKVVKGSAECSLCNYLVGRIETLLDKGLTVSQIITILENECAKTGPLAGVCKTITALYGPAIIQRIVNGLNPTAICTDVGLCTSTSPAARPTFKIQAN